MGNEVACARGRGVVFALALLTNNSVFLFRAKILRKPAIGRSNHVPPKNQLRAHFHWGENIAFCFARQLVAVQIVFWAARHGSFSLLVFLCVLYSLSIKLDCQLLQDSIGGFVFCSASSNRSSFPQKLKVASRKQEFFDDQSKYPSCITARGTVSVPLQHGSGPLLQPSITMRGTASVPLRYRSGPLLQCAVPPRYRFGTARALYYNAQRRHPVCVLQSFNSVGVMNFQENTKTNRNPQNATLTLVPALLQTGRSTLAPRHSEYSSRSTILNKGLGVGLAINVSKVKLHFRVNLWPSFWGPKTLAKPVSPRRASPVQEHVWT